MANTSPAVRYAGNIFCLLGLLCAFGGSVGRENQPVKCRCRCRAIHVKLSTGLPTKSSILRQCRTARVFRHPTSTASTIGTPKRDRAQPNQSTDSAPDPALGL